MSNKLYLALVICIFLTCTVSAQTSQMPIAQWKMSGNAGDSSGFGNHGIMNAVISDTGRNGKPNSALRFNNSNSYISVPNNNSFNTPEFSICATVKPKDFYPGACQVNQIFLRGDYIASGSYGLIIYDNTYDGGNCNLLDTNKEVFAGHISTNTNSANEHYWQYTPTVHTNDWYSVVFTYDGSLGRIYVNGVQKSAIPVYIPVGIANVGVVIGRNSTGSTAYPYNFTGLIDDITLYNRVLTLSEIKTYDTSTMPPKVITPPPPASVNELAGGNIRVYPNPAHETAAIHFSQPVIEGAYTVYNGLGKVMITKSIAGNDIKIVTGSWPAGQYVLRIVANGQVVNQRLGVE